MARTSQNKPQKCESWLPGESNAEQTCSNFVGVNRLESNVDVVAVLTPYGARRYSHSLSSPAQRSSWCLAEQGRERRISTTAITREEGEPQDVAIGV